MTAPSPLLHRSQLLAAALRRDFVSFIRKTFSTVSPGVEYAHGWHIEAVAWHLNEVACGRMRRLIITVPPRNLKSIISSVALPAFVLGHDPSRRIVAVSYAADLAAKHSADFRAVMRAPWYREIFPATIIDRKKDTELEIRTTGRGSRYAASVGGTLTGRGGDLIVVDDPQKPIDALSPTKRRRVIDWFSNTLLSRLDDKRTGAIVVVMQRLHVDDVVGHLLDAQSGWVHLNLPAIADSYETIRIGERATYTRTPGTALHPEREPIEVLDSLKAVLGANVFQAQYQQAPVPEGGAMIKREWLKRYQVLPGGHQFTVQSWDTAQKPGSDNDFSVCTTWVVAGSAVYLKDVVRARLDYPSLKREAQHLYAAHKPAAILIEDAGAGTSLAQELRREGKPVIPIRPEMDKVTRMSVRSVAIESGQLYLPISAPWIGDFEAELLSFPNGRFDDQVDTVSQLLNWLHYRTISGPLHTSYLK